jgi:hypothetical protein
MPSPVSFLLSLATFPVNYTATPQQFAIDLVDRLTITPSAPWNSFLVGTLIPTSNQGPVLFDTGSGMKWLVWNDGTGAYVDLVVQGDGIVNESVPLSAMAAQTPGGIFIYDASGNPTTLAPATAVTGPTWVSGHTYQVGQYVTSPITGFVYLCTSGPVTSGTDPSLDSVHWTVQPSTTSGDVLTQSNSGIPTWQALPSAVGAANFELVLSAIQNFTTSPGGSLQTVNFNTAKFLNGVLFNNTLFSVQIPANQQWYFYFQGQFDYSGAASFWQVTANITSSAGPVVGGILNSAGALPRAGMSVSGIMPVQSTATTVLVQLLPIETPGSTDLSMQLNANNNRFGGFRIS